MTELSAPDTLGQPSLAAQSLAAFDEMLANSPNFRSRAGQREMAKRIGLMLDDVTLGEHPNPNKAIAVIQAGTGVGKSAAYLCTMLTLALQRKTRLLVSTATVALQEQLMNKDLVALAAVLPTPFAFALAKGRGRYVCKLKLERLVGFGTDAEASDSELFALDEEALPMPDGNLKPSRAPSSQRQRLAWYDSLAKALASGRWDGDRDSLAEPPDLRDWQAVAAERHTCTARYCPRFRNCSYYQARSALAQAQVIVANHDLVLASLGRKALPELGNCLLVFDEAHHLPAVALDQFSSSMDLTALRWLDKLPKILLEVADKIGFVVAPDVVTLAQQLKASVSDVARLALDLLRAANPGFAAVHRFADGVLPAALLEPMLQISAQSGALSEVLETLGAQLKKRAKEDPGQAASSALQYAKLGQMAPRLAGVVNTSAMLLAHSEQPLAKWLESDVSSGLVFLSAHACPIVPGALLHQHVWSQVRGAVLTSASLASCGSFDYFLSESGLDQLDCVDTLAVDSPFDYTSQGQLLVVDTAANPRQVESFTREMVSILILDLQQVKHGALVLFTSRAQMKAALEMLDAPLLELVLVQGQLARERLLRRHKTRVESGQPSVIFGLQSFGEGLDLPGQLCETVFITKLPFAALSDPVQEARAEWLKREGRDAFSELVVPATGMRLLQWTGRAIRSEDDQARVVCYDKRLLDSHYGRRMLQGLPPYALLRRSHQQAQLV